MRQVLLIEDEASVREVVTRILERNGFEVSACADGAEGLARLERTLPDLVICDVMMPGMDGLEVVETIRARPGNARLPVLLITAKHLDEDVLRGYQSGADYYLVKPFTERQLLGALRAVAPESMTLH